jgi:hypothetical protein
MTHEKIIDRESTQYQIHVRVIIDSYRNDGPKYRCNLFYRAKGKRSWLNIPYDIHDYEYKKLSMDERQIYSDKNMLRFVTPEEIHQAKLELWEKLKP